MESWQRLVGALGDTAARLQLRPPASPEAIVGAETLFDRPLPAEYRSWLAIADGQEPGALSVFPSGGYFLPLAEVVEAWLTNAKFVVPEWDSEPVAADALVRPVVWHATRIPIGTDGLTHDPFLDLWPGPRGSTGQLITLISECDFAVIGASLDDFFTRTANLLIGGQIRIDGDTLVRTSNAWLDLVERR